MSDHLTSTTSHDHQPEPRTPPLDQHRFPDHRPRSSTLRHPAVSLCETPDFIGEGYLDTLCASERASEPLRGH